MSLYRISKDDSKYLEPSGTGSIDVVNDYAWTKSPKNARADVPYASLKEYQQSTGQLGAALLYYSRVAATPTAKPGDKYDPSAVYQNKYIATPTGFTYKFPFFSTKKFNRSSAFSGEDNNNPIEGAVPSFLEEFATGIKKAVNVIEPGNVNFELPQKWKSTTEGDIEIKFSLSNTGTLEDIDKNRDLAYLLTYQNSANRRNLALNDPIVIYTLEIPDIVNFPACYISDLTITNLGNTRILQNSGIPRIIPEAYGFSMTFRPLILPTRNIMSGLDSGTAVQAISDISQLPVQVQAIAAKVPNT